MTHRPAASGSRFGLLFGAFIVLLGAGGMRQSFGVFIHPWEHSLEVDRAQVALVAALALLVFGAVRPLAGRAIDLYGPGLIAPAAIILAAVGALLASGATALWEIALLYGVVTSIGFGSLSNAPLSSIVARHFTGRRGLALGLCSTGTPLGQMVLSPGLGIVIAEQGWRTAMTGMGIALLIVVLPLALLFLRREPALPASGAPGVGVRDALASRAYQLLVGSYVICGMTTAGLVQTHLVPHALDLGVPEVQGARVLGLIGLCNAGGLLVSGWAADRWGVRIPLTLVYCTRASALIWLAMSANEAMLFLFAVLYGLTDMATIPLTASGTAALFGRQTVGALYGLAALGHQIGSALGAWLGGQGYLFWGNYQPVILIGAALATLAAIMAANLRPQTQAVVAAPA